MMFDFPTLDKDEFEALIKQSEPDHTVYDLLFNDFPLQSDEGKLPEDEKPLPKISKQRRITSEKLQTPPTPTPKYGKWSKDEDTILKTAVNEFLAQNKPIQFAEIVKKLPNRSLKQAKERYLNCLKPNIKKGAWNKSELEQLINEMIENRQNWTMIQKNIPNRSMHCIKSKGRKLLGEILSKRLQKLTKNKVKQWTEEEEKRALEVHENLMKSKYSNLIGCSVTINEIDSFLLTKEFEEMLEHICVTLGTGKSIARIDRKLIEICQSPFCQLRKERLMNDQDFKNNWTVLKAKRLRITLGLKQPLVVPELTENDLLELKIEKDLESFSEELALDFLFDSNEEDIIALDTEHLQLPSEQSCLRRKRSNDGSVGENNYLSESPVRSLRRVDYDDQEMLKSLLFTAIEEDKEDDEAQKVLTLVRNYERYKSIDDSSGIAKRLIEIMTHVYGKQGFNQFANTMKANNFTWFDSSICKVLDGLKPHSSDPRFTKRFLNPEPEEAPFDPFLPIGTMLINFVTKIVKDVDSNALMIARGDTRNKHSWKFVPGRAEAVLRLYYIMPSLQETGKAISHVRWYRCDGTMGVFLCYYEVLSFKTFSVKVTFQDVTYKMKDILSLPDFY